MADTDAGTTDMEMDDSRKESDQVVETDATRVEVTANCNSSNAGRDADDNDESHRRCYTCCMFCNSCCRPFMTLHNPLPDNATRFGLFKFL